MALALLALLALSSSLASGCGEGAPPEPAILDAGVAPRIGRLARPVAFEGHSGFVNELRAEGLEVDLRGALVRIEPS
ncbi:MAG: hypothetical protein OEY14_19070, partial [Myxococcales bacterium]|nr:hypothetical protein [Myxococcales bacterium]